MFFDLFLELCNRRGVKPGRAADEMGINRATVTNWKKNGYTPRGNTLNKVAEYFGVTESYLLGSEQKNAPIPSDERVPEDPDIRMIARAGKKMTPEQRENLRKYAQYMFPEAFKDDDT